MLQRSNIMLRSFLQKGMHGGARPTVVMQCQQRATISFQHSMQTCQIPQYHVTDTVNPTSAGKTLVMTFSKVDNSIGSIAEHINSMIPDEVACDVKTLIAECVEDASFSADNKEKYILRIPKTSDFNYKHLVLLGVGSEADSTRYKDVGKQLYTIAKDLKAPDLDLLLDSTTVFSSVLHGVEDASYDDKRYKGIGSSSDLPSHDEGKKVLESLSFTNVPTKLLASLTDLVNIKHKMSVGVHIAKELVGAPANSKTPLAIAAFAHDIAAQHNNMECQVLGQQKCEELKMGGFLAVQQGSKFPPQFVHMIYNNKNTTPNGKKIAFVGKGLTFDSGGYNLKVGAGSLIEMMKFDMGGLGAVLGTAAVVASMDASPDEDVFKGVELHFISAVCENMISRDAMRPGDIVSASNGKTIEIINTDAEGRLTLADALVYAEREVGAEVIIDLATLTGASMVALGENIGSLFTSSQSVQEDLVEAAKTSGDQLWTMPLHDEYKANIKSKIADIKNIGDGRAGSITAALFLQEFVSKDKEWAHIDMAGPVWDNSTHKPTGYGVKLLMNYILNQVQQLQK